MLNILLKEENNIKKVQGYQKLSFILDSIEKRTFLL